VSEREGRASRKAGNGAKTTSWGFGAKPPKFFLGIFEVNRMFPA